MYQKSKSSANRYDIDKWDVKPAEAHVICSRPSYFPRTLVIQLNYIFVRNFLMLRVFSGLG